VVNTSISYLSVEFVLAHVRLDEVVRAPFNHFLTIVQCVCEKQSYYVCLQTSNLE
jgi:hypothetical protein